jgi:hypothetical protein
MPAVPAYFHRLGDACELFGRLDNDWVDRSTVEQVLGVSKTVAWRILRRCGAVEGPGNTLVCRRDELVAALRRVQETGQFERESRRRERLTGYLERLAEIGRSRRTTVATEDRAMDLINTRFERLPTGITLTPKRLSIDFSSPEEFLQRVGSVIFALQNDYEAVRAFIESEPKAP